MTIHRHKTAIIRRKFSKPVQLLLDDGILTPDTPFFDYGCGYGEDVKFLHKLKFQSNGWDPHFKPDESILDQAEETASIVNLGYILNIIEDPGERAETLKKAWTIAHDLLVVSVMIRDNLPQSELEQSFGDGVVTSWNTFQKYYRQGEFREYIESVLGVPVTMSSLGVAYVFKTDRYRKQYLQGRLASTGAYLSEQIREAEYQRIISEWISLYHELGRPPAKTEFAEYNYVIRAFGSLENAQAAIRAELDVETVAQNAQKRKTLLLNEIARNMIKGGGKTKASDLTSEYQGDLKIFYGNFASVLTATTEELKTLSSLETVSQYINESTVGKVLPDDIYIHADSLEYAPAMLQLLVELSKMILPDDVPYNIVKIARNSHHVTFLDYPDFLTDPHPALSGAMKVILHKNKLDYRDYRKSENPPILHRKELFIHSEHPHFELFSQLTSDEEEAGLLGRKDIGHRSGWAALLEEKGYKIEGHRLMQI